MRLIGEVLGLKFATDANSYYLYSAPIINVFTDCIALEGIFNKQLGDIKNKRIRDMVERIMCFNFKFHHIPGKDNKISDCFSRLTRRIREAEHFYLAEPILADRSVIKIAIRRSLGGIFGGLSNDGPKLQHDDTAPRNRH